MPRHDVGGQIRRYHSLPLASFGFGVIQKSAIDTFSHVSHFSINPSPAKRENLAWVQTDQNRQEGYNPLSKIQERQRYLGLLHGQRAIRNCFCALGRHQRACRVALDKSVVGSHFENRVQVPA